MSIRRRLVFLLIGILILSSAFLSRQMLNAFRKGYADVVESQMYDFSMALSAQIEVSGGLENSRNYLDSVFQSYRERRKDPLHADAGGFDVYVTDANGILVYSSKNPEEVGKDYSQWRDVYLTLRNAYGARSTRTDPNDPSSSVYFVASPIRKDGKIQGVVSVIKSEQSVAPFLSRAFRQGIPYVLLGLVLVAVFTALVMSWITRPIHRLEEYALSVSQGKAAVPPQVDPKELRSLLEAFEKMRITLEGRREIESFIQGLVHELKSPLTSIRGSAELSLEPIAPERREKFLRNILDENHRLQRLLDELLRLARLESRFELSHASEVSIGASIQKVITAFEALAETKGISLTQKGDAPNVVGDSELIESALRCLVLNAFDFSPEGGKIEVSAEQSQGEVKVIVRDQGVGVPEYAREKIFERFFSLERPGRAEKSTGLGLNFVREVMKLHRGSVELIPSEPGAAFLLRFPVS